MAPDPSGKAPKGFPYPCMTPFRGWTVMEANAFPQGAPLPLSQCNQSANRKHGLENYLQGQPTRERHAICLFL